jgi:hypothetical protein
MEILPLGDKKRGGCSLRLVQRIFWQEILQTREGEKKVEIAIFTP